MNRDFFLFFFFFLAEKMDERGRPLWQIRIFFELYDNRKIYYEFSRCSNRKFKPSQKKIQDFYFILLLMLVDNKLIISKKRKKLDEARNFFQKILKFTFSKREKKEM